MDTFIDSRFERLEKALANLIDSVTKYHPSAAQAKELEAADQDLSDGLEQVEIHQNNYLRIEELRKSSAVLDDQIRETLSSLALTRKDIVTTQVTTFPAGPNNPIAYDELLSYARRISKTTMPPASTINGITSVSETQTPAPDGQVTGGAVTPSAPTPSQTQSPATVNGASHIPSEQPTQQNASSSSMNTGLPEVMSQYLNPLSGQLFFPWPAEDKIRSGALASNQVLSEQGLDPKGYDPVVEEARKQKEEEERRQQEEQVRAEREERERTMRREAEKARLEREKQREKDLESWRRGSIAGSSGGPAASGAQDKKQFQFTNLDDLDDDED